MFITLLLIIIFLWHLPSAIFDVYTNHPTWQLSGSWNSLVIMTFLRHSSAPNLKLQYFRHHLQAKCKTKILTLLKKKNKNTRASECEKHQETMEAESETSAHWSVRMKMFTLSDYFYDGILSSNHSFEIQTQPVISLLKDPLSITPYSLSLSLSS